MKLRRRTLDDIAEMICGNEGTENFIYRSSSFLTRFFREADTDFQHDGTTRAAWVAARLEDILAEPVTAGRLLPDTFTRVIALLMDPEDAVAEGPDRPAALARLNRALRRGGFEAFYAPDGTCYLRQIATHTVLAPAPDPHRPFSADEVRRRDRLAAWLDTASESEDELIEQVLLPLFRQLGFQRITAAGHKDKAYEFGKDIWMKFVLPTRNVLYFGIQAKKGKLDAAGMSHGSNRNVAEVHQQALMMLGHEIFDPEINKRVLVDHAFIVAGGEITKAARAWIGNELDHTKRSQIMFLDREDLLNLHVASGLPLPDTGADSDPAGTAPPARPAVASIPTSRTYPEPATSGPGAVSSADPWAIGPTAGPWVTPSTSRRPAPFSSF